MDSSHNTSSNSAFRAIETDENRSLDAVAVAAVSAFCALQRPARQDRAQIDLLIRPQLQHLGRAALQRISAQLSSSAHAPVQLLHAIAALPVAISAPLILRSPLLTDDFLDDLAERMGEDHRKVVLKRAGRREPADLTTQALRDKLSQLKQAEQGEKAPTEEWETLVSAVCIGHDVPPSGTDDLVALALSSNPAFLQTRICDLLDLPFAMVAAAMADPEGGETTALLRAAGVSPAEGLLVALSAARLNLSDTPRMQRLRKRFFALSVENAREMVAGWQREYECKLPVANDRLAGIRPDEASVA